MSTQILYVADDRRFAMSSAWLSTDEDRASMMDVPKHGSRFWQDLQTGPFGAAHDTW